MLHAKTVTAISLLLIFLPISPSSASASVSRESPRDTGQSLFYRGSLEVEQRVPVSLVLLDQSTEVHGVRVSEESEYLDTRTLIKLHGIFMVVAWMGTTAVGVLVARYFKRTWTKRQFFGTQPWFFWHRICMMFTWSLTLTAFTMIFIDVDGWSAEELPHAVLGTLTTLLCFLHPILASLRPTLDSPRRKYFNMGHAFGGTLAQILALVTIFLAVLMPKAELPFWLVYVLAAFVLCLVGTHAGFTFLAYKAENHPQFGDRDQDAPYSTERRYGLAIAAVVFLGFIVTFATVILLAPI